MNCNTSARRFFLLLSLFTLSLTVNAQPTLPDIGGITKDGINILSWVNPYRNGVKSVTVQRSADSTYNFATIGVVGPGQNGTQTFIDSRPMLGVNWYRVVVLFSSETDWKSNLIKIVVDSAAIANRKPLPTNDSLQALISKMGNTSSALESIQTVSYPKSRYVFTNPFTGNINIEIDDVFTHSYTLIFYSQAQRKVLEIPRVNDTVVILDRRNFQQSGIYQFKLLKDKKEFETGYITIY